MRRSKPTTFPRWMTPYIFCIWFLILWGGPVAPASEPVFDMAAIQDANTLDIEVLQNWHSVEGLSATRQKLVTINVGDLWEGQQYRIPVRMVVPANQKATGFHLTGGSTPSRLKRDTKPNQLERELLKSGVGLVFTVVQEPGSYGQRALAADASKRFAETLNPHSVSYTHLTLPTIYSV